MNALFICAMVVTAATGSEQGSVVALEKESAVAWYKESSVQIAAAAITTAAAVYGFAVYNDKLASPMALVSALLGTKIVKEISQQTPTVTVSDKDNVLIVEPTDENKLQTPDKVESDELLSADKVVTPDQSNDDKLQGANGQDEQSDLQNMISASSKELAAHKDFAVEKMTKLFEQCKVALNKWAQSDSIVTD